MPLKTSKGRNNRTHCPLIEIQVARHFDFIANTALQYNGQVTLLLIIYATEFALDIKKRRLHFLSIQPKTIHI